MLDDVLVTFSVDPNWLATVGVPGELEEAETTEADIPLPLKLQVTGPVSAPVPQVVTEPAPI